MAYRLGVFEVVEVYFMLSSIVFLNKIIYYRKYILTKCNVDDIMVAERKVS